MNTLTNRKVIPRNWNHEHSTVETFYRRAGMIVGNVQNDPSYIDFLTLLDAKKLACVHPFLPLPMQEKSGERLLKDTTFMR